MRKNTSTVASDKHHERWVEEYRKRGYKTSGFCNAVTNAALGRVGVTTRPKNLCACEHGAVDELCDRCEFLARQEDLFGTDRPVPDAYFLQVLDGVPVLCIVEVANANPVPDYKEELYFRLADELVGDGIWMYFLVCHKDGAESLRISPASFRAPGAVPLPPFIEHPHGLNNTTKVQCYIESELDTLDMLGYTDLDHYREQLNKEFDV